MNKKGGWAKLALLLALQGATWCRKIPVFGEKPPSSGQSDKGQSPLVPPHDDCLGIPPIYPWSPSFPDRPPFPPNAPDQPSPPPSPPPMFCPQLAPYPGISSVQTLECDIENPQAEVCGLSVLTVTSLQLQPGQALVVSYINLNSSLANLSRLILSREVLEVTQPPAWDPSQPRSAFVATGFCPSQASLESCLHDLYHGVPAYRACQYAGCFAVNMVSEQLDPKIYGSIFWSGIFESQGDTSLFATQLWPLADPESGGTLLYFLASKSSLPVEVSYTRSARLLYRPGSIVVARPPANASFVNVTVEPLTAAPPSPPLDSGGGQVDGGVGNNSSSSIGGGSDAGPVDDSSVAQDLTRKAWNTTDDGESGGTNSTVVEPPSVSDLANASSVTGTGDVNSPGPMGGQSGWPPSGGGSAGEAVRVARAGRWAVVLLLQYLAARALAAAAAGV